MDEIKQKETGFGTYFLKRKHCENVKSQNFNLTRGEKSSVL